MHRLDFNPGSTIYGTSLSRDFCILEMRITTSNSESAVPYLSNNKRPLLHRAELLEARYGI